MKTIAVVCNNRHGWLHFVETLQFTLSKDNHPYKAVAGSILDINKNTKYILVPNCYKGIDNIRGHVISDYVTIAKIVDNDVHDYIMTHMREDYMRHNEKPNILRVMLITVVVFWSVVYIGLKLIGII